MPLLKNGKEFFIAVNILPSPIAIQAGMRDPLEHLQEQVDVAKGLGFTHAWINPISVVPPETVCKRRCLDTGVFFDLTGSLYAPNDPKEIRPDFDMEKVRGMVQAEKKAGFFILVDFVWKHVSVNSSLIKSKPAWFGKKKKQVKDVVEYNFEMKDGHFTVGAQEIIDHLKSCIDLLLDPISGYGFTGLRIDAASQLSPLVRRSLYQHIREKWPESIIFEEVLFDGSDSEKVISLVKDSERDRLYSDFVTSNLYYQKPNSFGALPSPDEMGDSLKLQLANRRGIGFTGNHDHYSLGWGIVLQMAAKLLIAQDQLHLVDVTVSPFEKYPFIKCHQKARSTIINLANGELLIENFSAEEQGVIQYLLPFANIIARALLSDKHEDHDKYFEIFRLELLEKMANRTLAGISGYFFLFSELISPFETPRIFSGRLGAPLDCLLLTENDLFTEWDKTIRILGEMKKRKTEYKNFSNFEKLIYGVMKKKEVSKEELQDQLKICLPYVVEYLRNHPEHNEYGYKEQYDKELSILNQHLDLAPYIEQINKIYSQLTTIGSENYHTFMSLDHFKIFVRCSDQSTDVIILNLAYQKVAALTIIDLEKIALWFQARLYPYLQHVGQEVSLSKPFSGEKVNYYPASYSDYWKEKVGKDAFSFSYQRILGHRKNHQTNLFLGTNITTDLSEEEMSAFSRVVQLYTPVQVAYNILAQRSMSIGSAPMDDDGIDPVEAFASSPSSKRGKGVTFFAKEIVDDKSTISGILPVLNSQ